MFRQFLKIANQQMCPSKAIAVDIPHGSHPSSCDILLPIHISPSNPLYSSSWAIFVPLFLMPILIVIAGHRQCAWS